jgi:hypothetical protein
MPLTKGRVPTEKDKKRALEDKISPEEVVARDCIVNDTWLKCHYTPGARLIPKEAQHREKYGVCIMRGMVKSYHELSVEEYKDGKPMICTIVSEKAPNKEMVCHPDFLTTINNGGSC